MKIKNLVSTTLKSSLDMGGIQIHICGGLLSLLQFFTVNYN